MHATTCARALAVIVLLLSYGAVGARQPAVRVAIPLPVRAADVAEVLALETPDRSQLLIDVVRLLYDAPGEQSAEDTALRARLLGLLRQKTEQTDTVPLPLDPSIWRDAILERQVPDHDLAAAILSDRSTALLYHGLVALDDATLGWLGADRETLKQLRRHAGAFAAFGRSVRVRAGRVIVPGGPDNEALWEAIVGVEPASPAAFVQKLFRAGNGRLAWFYDTMAHLDEPRLALALGGPGTVAARIDRARDLLDTFESTAAEWSVADRPFTRPWLDPGLVLSLLATTRDGRIAGPFERRVWERVFRDDAIEVGFEETSRDQIADGGRTMEPAWLVRRISLVPTPVGRRRLDTVLFAQRVFPERYDDLPLAATALRGFAAFPTLIVTLERMGLTAPALLVEAAKHAAALNGIRSFERRRLALAQFQSALGAIDRAARLAGIDGRTARALVSSLVRLNVSPDGGYDGRFVQWIQGPLLDALEPADNGAAAVEDALLAAMAGVRTSRPAPPSTEWEGRRYAIDPPLAELHRLRAVRQRQLDLLPPGTDGSLDGALAAAARRQGSADERLEGDRALAQALTSILYAAYLGAPDGTALLAAADVAERHDFGMVDAVGASRSGMAWQYPREQHGMGGWRVTGSLLALETALGGLSLRRLDSTDMPAAPALSINERQTATLTAALLNPTALSNDALHEIAAAIARGRARVDALGGDRAEFEAIAADAGFSEWRREALGWSLAHDRAAVPSRFSLVDLYWVGSPRLPAGALDHWGTASVLLDGCLCLRMPRPVPWETWMGRPATGQLATRGADVTLRVAEVLADLRLPASLVPSVVAFAMQDVIDLARPAYFDDWAAFERAARAIPHERIVDYVAALAAGGALRPLPSTGRPD